MTKFVGCRSHPMNGGAGSFAERQERKYQFRQQVVILGNIILTQDYIDIELLSP